MGIILKDSVIGNLDKIGDAADRISAVFKGPLATAIVFVARTVEALINQMGAMFRSMGHLSTISPKDLLTKQGRASMFEAMKASNQAFNDASPIKAFNDIFFPKEERKDDPLPKQERDVKALMKVEEEKKVKTALDPMRVNPDSAAKIGGFIGGAAGGVNIRDILGRQQLTAQQQIARNTDRTAAAINRLLQRSGEKAWGER